MCQIYDTVIRDIKDDADGVSSKQTVRRNAVFFCETFMYYIVSLC